mgnify:CR=1 FL=1|jgi:hypothetical protein
MKRFQNATVLIAGMWTIGLTLGVGCSQGPEGPQSVELRTVAAAHSTAEHSTIVSTWQLTPEEIRAFVDVVQRLPGKQVPEFVGADLPRLTSSRGLEAAIQEYRHAIRLGVSPGHQSEMWAKNPALQVAFQEMGISPMAFADLMVRISCAWSSWKIQGELSVSQVRQQLDQHIARLAASLEQSAPPDLQDQLESLELLVGRSELLGLLEQVPRESIKAVASARDELRPIMPSDDQTRQLAEDLKTQARILRVGY